MQIKVLMVNTSGKTVKALQIIDVSSQILYHSANMKNQLQEVVQATASHEMRNPMNSIIG